MARTYGDSDDGWSYTLKSEGPALVIFDVLHPDRKGGWGFAIKEADEQALAITAALIEAGHLPPGIPGPIETTATEWAPAAPLATP